MCETLNSSDESRSFLPQSPVSRDFSNLSHSWLLLHFDTSTSVIALLTTPSGGLSPIILYFCSLFVVFTLTAVCTASIYWLIVCPSWSVILFRTYSICSLLHQSVWAFGPTGCSLNERTSTVTSCVPQDRVWRRISRNSCLFSKQTRPSRTFHERKLHECATSDSLTQTEIQGTRDPLILFFREAIGSYHPGENQAGSMC